MRYAIFSDVHSNLEAFEVVLEQFKKEKIDKFIFLGDIVGYGANPNEVISLLKVLDPVCIAGNHDWAAVKKFDASYFNPYAKEAVFWTAKVLGPVEKKFLLNLTLLYEEEDFICVHGTLDEPEKFHYVMSSDDAALTFRNMTKDICFIGHSHYQETYVLKDDKLQYSRQTKFDIEEGKKYIINVGSVGQPRDGDNRASFCIYDNKEKLVNIYRLEYNIKKCADKILESKLPRVLAERLYVGR